MPSDLAMQSLRTLDLSAASGLVVREGLAWVVADDRLAIEGYRLQDGTRLQSIALLPGAGEEAIEKKHKPDLEALVELPDGRMLTLGSGSRPNRERGFLVDGTRVATQDLSALYARLRIEIGPLNIEGAVCMGSQLLLAHRGLGHGASSHIARLDASACLSAPDQVWPADALIEIRPIELGDLDGVPLGLTDLALDADGRPHYLAAAENTDDAYLDGQCSGSVIGMLDAELRPANQACLRPKVKAEGLAWWKRESGDDHWLVVTDADDPGLKATLYLVKIPVDRS